MPVINGQAVSAEVTNPAFLDAQVDDIALGKIGFHNTDPQSGPNIDNVQRCVNRLFTASGVDENVSNGTTYNATSGTIVNGDPYQLALKILANKFDSITGHTHNTSVAGDGGPITVTAAAATTGSLGTVYLSTTTPLDVTGSDIIGTYNGQVANADHAHKGVRSIAPSGYSQLFDDIVFTPSGNIDISTSGQQVIFHSSGGGSGVSSVAVSGSIAITGNITLVPSGGVVLSESGNNITIYSSPSGSISDVAASFHNLGINVTAGNALIYSTTDFNTGGGSYNGTTGEFTVPSSGVYMIVLFNNNGNNGSRYRFNVNGVTQWQFGISNTGGQATGSTIVSLTAGDKVMPLADVTSFNIDTLAYFQIFKIN